jgi:hypothetical protein
MTAKLTLVVMLAATCYGETGFEITLPASVPSENFAGRYLLTGSFGGFSGWLAQKENVESYQIETSVEGQPATRIKAVLYAPGCEIQTFDKPLADGSVESFDFQCKPLSTVAFQGRLTKSDALLKEAVEIRVNYIAYWADEFFGIHDGLVTAIPVGVALPDADNRFRITLPDFSENVPGRPGVFQFWARERTTGKLLGELIPGESKSKFGSLQIESAYPREIAFTTCAVPGTLETTGFAKRSDPDACGR